MFETTSNQLSSNVKMATFLVNLILSAFPYYLSSPFLRYLLASKDVLRFGFLGTFTAEVGEPVQTTRCMHVRPRFRYDEHVRDLEPPISNRAGRQADLTSSRPRNHFGFLSFIQRGGEAS